jgi:endonuclease/exonuclease/phosphatase family metal-dependent hydrolase
MPLFSKDRRKDQIPVISRPWWEWVIKTARENLQNPFIFIRDFNCDLMRRTEEDGLRLEQLVREGWTHAIPKNSDVRSFYSNPDSKGSTIDHVFLSPQLVLKKTEFILEKGPYHYAKHNDALSDHAVLLVEFDPQAEAYAS